MTLGIGPGLAVFFLQTFERRARRRFALFEQVPGFFTRRTFPLRNQRGGDAGLRRTPGPWFLLARGDPKGRLVGGGRLSKKRRGLGFSRVAPAVKLVPFAQRRFRVDRRRRRRNGSSRRLFFLGEHGRRSEAGQHQDQHNRERLAEQP